MIHWMLKRLWNISYIIFGKIHRISFILRIESFNEKLYLKPNHGNILFHVNFFVFFCSKLEIVYIAIPPAPNMKFSMMHIFCKCDQIRSFL